MSVSQLSLDVTLKGAREAQKRLAEMKAAKKVKKPVAKKSPRREKREPMRYTVFAMLIGLACCGGCMTQTVTRKTGMGQSEGKVLSSRTIWIWQKEFWVHK